MLTIKTGNDDDGDHDGHYFACQRQTALDVFTRTKNLLLIKGSTPTTDAIAGIKSVAASTVAPLVTSKRPLAGLLAAGRN